jgi:hypothetical protein
MVRPGRKSAKKDYIRLKKEMKRMTAHMRAVRTELGARLQWGCSGNIQYIILENKRYNAKEIAHLSDCYLVDSILLG